MELTPTEVETEGAAGVGVVDCWGVAALGVMGRGGGG